MDDFFLDSYLTLMGITKYYSFLRYSQYYSKERMQRYQFLHLKKLLRESAINVPYYKDLFRSIGFNPNIHFTEFSHFDRVPFLSKKDAKANADKLINPKKIANAIVLKTSGSTGEPFTSHVSYNAWIIEQAVIWRHWKWAGYNFRDKMAIVRSYAPKDGEALIKIDKIRNFLFYSPFHLTDQNIQFYLSHMIENGVEFLRGYPSSIFLLAEYLQKNGRKMNFNLKAILTASEVLTRGEREYIESNLGGRIFNHYGLAEVCVMMGDCEKHEGLHNYEEYGYLELLKHDEGGDKNVSRIVGTNLHNLAMPLIRYETGDLAEIAEYPCSCRRNLPVIKNILGRKDSFLISPNGNKISSVNFYTMFEYFSEIRKWQLVQVSENRVRIYLLTDYISEEALGKIKEGINVRFQSDMTIEFNINQPFFRLGEGKQNSVISITG